MDGKFQARYRRVAQATDRALVRLLAGLVGLLFAAQLLLSSPPLRRWLLLTDPGEGAATQLIIYPTSAPRVPEVSLLVNGRVVGNFAAGPLVVAVEPGQTLGLDGRASQATHEFLVTGAEGLAWPAFGSRFEVAGARVELGTVQTLP